MFLVLIHYIAPFERVLAVRDAHRAYLQEQYRAGRLVLSGPRPDQRGGVLLARPGLEPEVLAQICARDPYALSGVARHEVVEFEAKSWAEGFEPFLAPAPR